MDNPDDEIVELPISGELDLHTFRPSDLGELIPAFLEACLEKDIRRVRIIHGKGTGTLRETVHALLRRDPRVIDFHLAGQNEGAWGATIARLKSP